MVLTLLYITFIDHLTLVSPLLFIVAPFILLDGQTQPSPRFDTTMSLADKVSSLAVSDDPPSASSDPDPSASYPPTRAEPTPAPAPELTNLAVAGEWADAVKAYAGPRLSERALHPAHTFVGTEKLDAIFRTSAFPALWLC
jgi:hypothetical protein